MWRFDSYIYHKMITTIWLINTYFTPSNQHLFYVALMVRTFKTYSLRNFQVHNTVLLIQSPCCILSHHNLVILSLNVCTMTNIFPLLPPSGGGGLVTKSCPTLVTPWTVACQASLSMGFSSKNTGVGCHFLLQRIFLTQVSNLGLLHCRQILYQLSYEGLSFYSLLL